MQWFYLFKRFDSDFADGRSLTMSQITNHNSKWYWASYYYYWGTHTQSGVSFHAWNDWNKFSNVYLAEIVASLLSNFEIIELIQCFMWKVHSIRLFLYYSRLRTIHFYLRFFPRCFERGILTLCDIKQSMQNTNIGTFNIHVVSPCTQDLITVTGSYYEK